MAQNRISAALAQADKDAIMAAVKAIGEKLPFAIDLSPDDRKAMPKLGDKSLAFVTKALEVATQNPGFLPRDFDVEEFRKDTNIYADLSSIRQAIAKIFDLVDDTMVVAGSEAYIAALMVYNIAKAKNIGSEGLDSTIDELGKRFARKVKSAGLQPAAGK